MEGKTDVIFYDKQEIAYTKDGNKEYLLIVSGDIRIRVDDEWYTNRDVQDAIVHYGLTDNVLRDLLEKGRLEWFNNNWFEVLIKDIDEDGWSDGWGDTATDYDSAIKMLIEAISQTTE